MCGWEVETAFFNCLFYFADPNGDVVKEIHNENPSFLKYKFSFNDVDSSELIIDWLIDFIDWLVGWLIDESIYWCLLGFIFKSISMLFVSFSLGSLEFYL